jgi:hypothetical protein
MRLGRRSGTGRCRLGPVRRGRGSPSVGRPAGRPTEGSLSRAGSPPRAPRPSGRGVRRPHSSRRATRRWWLRRRRARRSSAPRPTWVRTDARRAAPGGAWQEAGEILHQRRELVQRYEEAGEERQRQEQQVRGGRGSAGPREERDREPEGAQGHETEQHHDREPDPHAGGHRDPSGRGGQGACGGDDHDGAEHAHDQLRYEMGAALLK